MVILFALLTGCFDSGGRAVVSDAEHHGPADSAESGPDENGPDPSDESPADDRADPTDDAVEPGIPPLYLYNLPDRWHDAAAEILDETDNHDFGRFEVSKFGESLIFHHSWGEERNDRFVKLTGYARKDDGRIDRMYVRGKQTGFDDQHLRHLRPYYEILIAASDPGLSPDERSGLMSGLFLDGDAATLAERSDTDGENTVTKRGIRYDVAAIASGEGKTFALVVTWDAACGGDSILSDCR
jgi:hypothetical protein